jgi:hypothetical protein
MIESRPEGTVEDPAEVKREIWCSGRTVALALDHYPDDASKAPPPPATLGLNVHPITLKVDSVACAHEDGECTRASAALHALYVLGATRIIAGDIVNKIHYDGWAQMLNEEEKAGRNPRKCILKYPYRENLSSLWQPREALDFLYAQEEQDRLELAEAEGAKKLILEEFHRIKCYYRPVGDGKMMFLKKKQGLASFDMKEVPEVIKKMTKLWTALGGNPDVLLSIALHNCEGAKNCPPSQAYWTPCGSPPRYEEFPVHALPPEVDGSNKEILELSVDPALTTPQLDSTMAQTPAILDFSSGLTAPTVSLDCGRLSNRPTSRKRKAGEHSDVPPRKKNKPSGFYIENDSIPTSTTATTASASTGSDIVLQNVVKYLEDEAVEKFIGAVSSDMPKE